MADAKTLSSLVQSLGNWSSLADDFKDVLQMLATALGSVISSDLYHYSIFIGNKVRHKINTVSVSVLSKFNGTSTPKGSYSAKTGVKLPYESKQNQYIK